jgi:hypothetical protein
MYGMDGNFSPLEWADAVGFHFLREDDKKKVIESGHYTSEGNRIIAPDETCPSTDTSTICHVDIYV